MHIKPPISLWHVPFIQGLDAQKSITACACFTFSDVKVLPILHSWPVRPSGHTLGAVVVLAGAFDVVLIEALGVVL